MGSSSQAGTFFHEIRWPVWWVPTVRWRNNYFARNKEALPCMRRCSWWVPAVRWKRFFHEIWWPVWWVPAVRWRNNYFACNKEPIPCGFPGPSCQPINVQYSSDGSRSLTTLTTPRREHQGGGRRRGLGRGRRGAGEDAAVVAHVERSTRVHCVIRRHFLACEYIAGGSDQSVGERFFCEIQKP